MSYLSISFTHKNTDIQTREKLAFSGEDSVKSFLKTLTSSDLIKEAVLLSTCNRVEIITLVKDIKSATTYIIESLSKYSGLDFDDLENRADIYDNEGAIHHLFTVASSLDSLVIGETQIVGQLKDAYKLALEKGYCDQRTTQAMQFAFKCAANVRNATSLGSGSVSVASTAVAKAKDILGDPSGVKALVIGAGEMSELTIKHLLSSKFSVILTSRDIKKAQLLADTFDEEIVVKPYEELNELINIIPVMITATSAPYPIIKQDMISSSKMSRYWFDIAVPRDIDDIESSNLQIFSVDDLQDIVNDNMHLRAKQAKQAYSIVSQEAVSFFEMLKTLEVEPVVKHLYTKGDSVIDKKIKNAIKKGFIKADDEANIRKLCETVLTEFLHQPSKNLKYVSTHTSCDAILGTVQSIFGLESNSNNLHHCEHSTKK